MKSKLLLVVVLLFSNPVTAQDDTIQPYVYHTVANGHYDIVVMDYNTGNTLYTIATDDYDCARALSPDNRYLHYSSGGGRNFPVGQGYLLDLHTGESLEIPQMQHSGAWSPDSRHLAFETTLKPGISQLRVYDLETAITTDLEIIDWSDSIAWHDNLLRYTTTEDNVLQILQWDGNAISPVIDPIDLPQSEFYTLSLSPDGQYLLIFLRPDDSDYQAYLVNIDDETLQQLPFVPGDRRVVWNSEANSFAYFNNSRLQIYDLNTNDVIHLASHYDVPRPETLQWSPDYRYLSFNQTRNYGLPDVFGWVNYYDFDSGEIEYVHATTNFIAGDIRWVSDTQFIYTYSSDRKDRTVEDDNLNELVLYDIQSDEHTILTDTPDLDEQIFCRLG